MMPESTEPVLVSLNAWQSAAAIAVFIIGADRILDWLVDGLFWLIDRTRRNP